MKHNHTLLGGKNHGRCVTFEAGIPVIHMPIRRKLAYIDYSPAALKSSGIRPIGIETENYTRRLLEIPKRYGIRSLEVYAEESVSNYEAYLIFQHPISWKEKISRYRAYIKENKEFLEKREKGLTDDEPEGTL
jgi:hypothetical protein